MKIKPYKLRTYKVKKVAISSNDEKNSFWKQANSLIDFSSPWDDSKIDKIEFKSLYNSENLFFQFKVDDHQTHIHASDDKNDSINNSDRVELFFRSDNSLNPYYCLEIDTKGRIMDFKAKPNKEFDFNWNWPSNEITVKSVVNKDDFIVEITISLESLRDLDLLKNGSIETGIYRAKYHQQKDKIFKPTWITWINPNTKTPNFHILTSFGKLELENY